MLMESITIPELHDGASDWLQDSRRSMLDDLSSINERWNVTEPLDSDHVFALVRFRERLKAHVARQGVELDASRGSLSSRVVTLRKAILERGDVPEADDAYLAACARLQACMDATKELSKAALANGEALKRLYVRRRELKDQNDRRLR